MKLCLHHHVPPVTDTPSDRALDVAAMFGLALDDDRPVPVLPRLELDLRAGQVVFVTGPSGSGKSTLLRLIADALRNRPDAHTIDLDDATPPDTPLVDGFDGLPLDQTLRLLATVGLAEAFVLLRRPSQLSDGQRFRARLAHALHRARARAGDGFTCVLADEFAATLDRVTAANLARAVRTALTPRPTVNGQAAPCLVAATTHDDLLEPLSPDVLVVTELGGRASVHRKPRAEPEPAVSTRP